MRSATLPGVTAALVAGIMASAAFAAAVPKTDYATYLPSSLPTLPPAGGIFTDPDFGTQILRVTDSRNGNNNHIAYSYWPTFNKDDSYFHIGNSGGGGILYKFDPLKMSFTNLGNLFSKKTPLNTTPRWEDSEWSGTDPNVLYGHEGPRIWSWNVVTKTYTLVKDFTGSPGWNAGDTVAQFSRSLDDNTFAFHKTNAGKVVGYEAWKRDTNSYPLRMSATQLDEVQIDKSGQYLTAKTGVNTPNSAIKVKVWDLSTGTCTDLTAGPPDFAPGHSDNGWGMIVGYEDRRNYTTSRSLATPHTFSNIFMPPGADQGGSLWQDGHLSMLMDGDKWAVQSKILMGTSTKTGPFLNEIFMAATDGSGNVIRLAHHHSVVVNQSTEYWDFPMANVSRDGRFIAFNSDWENSGQRDVFILRVPIPGDANMDYKVDQADYAAYFNNYGRTNATWDQGDTNGDRRVDQADYAAYFNNYGAGGGGQTFASAVAEPASAFLLITSFAVLLRTQRRETASSR